MGFTNSPPVLGVANDVSDPSSAPTNALVMKFSVTVITKAIRAARRMFPAMVTWCTMCQGGE